MKKQKKFIIFIIGLIIIVLAIGIYFNFGVQKPGKLDNFAECLTNSGTKFYGAFWCAHCNNQKKAFGTSAKKLPYIECSTSNGDGQNKVCIDASIEGYPTWVFPDGSRLTGEVPFETLSEKTSCPLPTLSD